ncbi:MAG TPA: alkaline phosphatase family protein [Gemmatimonadales bacterium]|nr:alkaline phosphatase family protein [Gemmatimonadales bacterium]
MTLVLLAALAGAPPPPPPPRSGLVVVIVVDQLRPDYLERWRGQLTGGLGRLLREGAVFTDAYQDHAVTETAPGHATVLSGRWPRHTGIASNELGVFDPSAPLLEARGPGASPHRFRGTALFDWLKAADSRARALSVSRKDRGAILPVGRAREQVYWYAAGMFTTSTFYADSLPAWVREFNALGMARRYAGRPWALLLPESAYAEPDDQPWEDPQGFFAEKTFPHTWPADSARSAVAFAARPEMDSLTLAFALAGAEALALGRRGTTDLLAVSLSTLDAVGHTFGPSSREVHDMVLRLDRYLGWFLDRVIRRYGRRELVIALTADHGVTPFPAEARAQGRPGAQAIRLDTLIEAVNAELAAVTGPATATARPGGFAFESGMILLPGTDTLRARGVNPDSLVDALAGRVRRVTCVARVDRPGALLAADTARDAVARRWLHHLPEDLPVVLAVTLGPDCVWGTGAYATHGQPTDLDAHVPLLLWGERLRRGRYGARVGVVDLAPTLARLLGIRPGPVDGRVLVEALRN